MLRNLEDNDEPKTHYKTFELSGKQGSRPANFWDKVPVIGGINQLYDKYDGTFLTMLGMQYFN